MTSNRTHVFVPATSKRKAFWRKKSEREIRAQNKKGQVTQAKNQNQQEQKPSPVNQAQLKLRTDQSTNQEPRVVPGPGYYLQNALHTINLRGQEYDKTNGQTGGAERSFAATAVAFNAIYGTRLQAYHVAGLLELLKIVRFETAAKKLQLHHDSVIDGVAYGALKAEQLDILISAVNKMQQQNNGSQVEETKDGE